MDSRQFAILVLVIFISAMALVFGENGTLIPQPANKNSSGNSVPPILPGKTTTTTVAAATNETTTVAAATNETTTVAAAANETTTVAAANTSTVVPSTAKVTIPSTTVTTQSPTTPTSAVPTATKPTDIVNDQSIRDVSSEKCLTLFEATDKSKWIPEKAILAVSDGQQITTIEQLCEQRDAVIRLDALCKVKLNSDDEKVIPIVAGVTSMFANICSDPKVFNVTIGDSTPCVESITTIAKNCSRSPTAKTLQIFPTELLFDEMMKENNCTSVFSTKQCIMKSIGEQLEKSDKCTDAQRSAVMQAIQMLILPCNPSAEPITTALPATITSVPTTTTAVPATKVGPPPNSASSLHVNVFSVLPFLLAFKFY